MLRELLKLKRNDLDAALALWRRAKDALDERNRASMLEQLATLQDDPTALLAAIKADEQGGA